MMPDNVGKKVLHAPSPDTFFKVAHMIQRERGLSDNTTMFYLSTDTASAVTAARSWFAQRDLTVVLFDDYYQVGLSAAVMSARGSSLITHKNTSALPHRCSVWTTWMRSADHRNHSRTLSWKCGFYQRWTSWWGPLRAASHR